MIKKLLLLECTTARSIANAAPVPESMETGKVILNSFAIISVRRLSNFLRFRSLSVKQRKFDRLKKLAGDDARYKSNSARILKY